MTAVAYDTFWRHTKLYNKNMLPKTIGTKYLDINPEGALLKEAQDIAEELKMMKRIYNEQLKVVKDFKRHLHYPQGRRTEKADSAYQIQKLLLDLVSPRDKPPHNDEEDRDEEDCDEEFHDETETPKYRQRQLTCQTEDDTLHEAEGVLELVKSRRAEIIELEQSAMHTCRQVSLDYLPPYNIFLKNWLTDMHMQPARGVLDAQTAAGVHRGGQGGPATCRRERQTRSGHHGLYSCNHLLCESLLPIRSCLYACPKLLVSC